MLIARPTTLAGIFDALDELPDAHLLAGGTDFMVEVNVGHGYPTSIVCLRGIPVRTDNMALSEPAASTG